MAPGKRILPAPDQLFRSLTSPTVSGMLPVTNARIITEVLSEGYRGNKPNGGLWTSTFTPEDHLGYGCDWEVGLYKNPMINHGYPITATLWPVWKLRVKASAKVQTITNLEEALAFTKRYHLASFEAGNWDIRLITTLITDWSRALADYDGVRLTPSAADQVAEAKFVHRVQTAFDTWNCESTLWGRWVFESVAPLGLDGHVSPADLNP